jgi:hypothetical protein
MAETGRMGFTRARDLIAVAAVAAVVGYLVVRLSYQRLPPLPRFAGVPAALLGLGEAVAGYNLRKRIRRRDGNGRDPVTVRPVEPLTAARAVMTAKATSLAGAALAGLWIGLLVYVVPSWSTLVAARADGITGIIGLAGAAVMIGGALFLEHCLRAPDADRSP